MKHTATKLFALVLAISMLFTLAACGKAADNNSAPAPATPVIAAPDAGNAAQTNTTSQSAAAQETDVVSDKDTFVATLTQDSGTLDPMFNIGWDCLGALRCVYEPLFDVTPDGEIIWMLATDIEREPTKWIIHLREGVKFANGNEFDADDVVFTLYRACNRPGASSLLPRVLSDEENLKVVDKYTVEVNFDRYEVGMETSTWPSIYMFDKESFNEETVATETMGTGAYQLTKVVTNSQWVMERRDDYWGELPKLREITFNILSESTQRVNALETGSTDFTNIAFQDLDYCVDMDGYEVILKGSGYTQTIDFSLHPDSCFANNVDARRAVALAIDRQAIADITFGGYATVSRLPVAMGKPDQDDSWLDKGLYEGGQNIELAKELAESSGLVNETITLINAGQPSSMATAELIQEDLRAIGVTVEIVTYDAGSWLSACFDGSTWDMAVNQSSGDTVAATVNRMNSIGGGMTYKKCEWEGSEEFHELLERTMGNPDEATRVADATRLLEVVDENVLWFSLVDMYDAYCVNNLVRGFEWSKSTMPAFWNLYWTE